MGTKKARRAASAAPPAGAAGDPVLTEKAELLRLLRAELTAALEVMVAAAHTARAAATHEEMKPENDKDTRGLEAGYLAAGQSARAAELRKALQELAAAAPRSFGPGEAAGPLALVEVEEELKERAVATRYFLSPWGGGLKLKGKAGEVLVVTPQSPLGQALLGKRAGDVVELAAGGRLRELAIRAVT
jgi:hypothetical protein